MHHLQSLWPYFLSHWKQFAFGLFAIFCSNVLHLVPSYLIRQVIDGLNSLSNGNFSIKELTTFSALIIGASLLAGFFTIIMRRQIVVASRQIEYEIRRDLFQHLLTLDKRYYHKVRTGDIINRLTGDLGAIREMFGSGTVQGSHIIVSFITSFVVMFSINWQLTLIVLAIIPIIIIILSFLARLIHQRHQAVQEQNSIIAAKAQENFSGARVIKGYAIEEKAIEEYRDLNLKLLHLNISLIKVDGPIRSFTTLLIGIAFGIVLWFGGRMVLSNDSSFKIGMLVQYLLILGRLAWPIMMVGWITSIFQRGISSWARLEEILYAHPSIYDKEGVVNHHIQSLKGEITFENVSVAFENEILRDINLHIPAGTFVGITGPTGSGKTVLAQLISRSIDPTTGIVRLDGYPLPEIPLQVLRKHLSVVPQEPFLFSDTIANNVGFGLEDEALPSVPSRVSVLKTPPIDYKAPSPDPHLVTEALHMAGLGKDINHFPNGDQTMLGERGVTLSGGQRQRTAIARALARRPAVLILDDSLSAVDTETEGYIINNIRKIAKDRTVIMIGHRISTLRHADKIVVLEKGKIVEEGSHEDLMNQQGHYAELERKQRLAEHIQ